MGDLRVRISCATWLAADIISYELRMPDGAALPAFTAGAHVDLHLGSGLVRSYSLVNSQAERHRYVIAVQKDRTSRGGSKWIHERCRVGDIVAISAPRNNFPLNEAAENSLFIAGGIGITPIMSMIARLTELGRRWELVYCARTRDVAAFTDILKGNVRFNFDGEPGGRILDIATVVATAPRNSDLYCCGPLPMLCAFEAATANLAPERVHVEYFTPKEAAALEGGFKVTLARTGREFSIPAGKSILDVLIEAGIDVPYSCMEGVCGSCETGVLEGAPDHRDSVLTDNERAAGRTMMICCSGAKTNKLVLDL